MQRRLSIALSLAALLIGGATWYRIVGATDSSSTLAVIDGNEDQITYIDTPLSGEGLSTATSSANLSSTDLVGRQLMYDYLSLASQGQATDENVGKLVENYASTISNLGSYRPVATADIKMVPDSREGLQSYSEQVSQIYGKYHALAADVVRSAGDISDVESERFASTMNDLGRLYSEAVLELKEVRVPVSLSVDHLKLLNNYLSSAQALSAISGARNDAATAYGALSTQAENSAEETDIILSMQSKLLGNGILFNAGR